MTISNIPEIIYKDPSLVVVEKMGGMLSVPGRGADKQDCVVSRIKKNFPDCIEQPSVHRLDMDTSGIMVLALTRAAHRNLSIQFEKRLVEKRYIALVSGEPIFCNGVIELSFRLDPLNRPYQIYDPVNGKIGISRWRKLALENGNSRIEFIPLTGRTHQLRVHSAHELGLNCPIIGDRLYGTGRQGDRLMLHASYLSFYHPESEKRISFDSKVPF
jgi:tRNA pseudouridine32 synthase / 23S rRNA pseudouridine746 synthase